MAVVSTGQITIVDQNDARPISAMISVTPSLQQVYSKDESTISWVPNWSVTESQLVLSPKVYVGGVGSSEEVSGKMIAPQFSTSIGGTAITGTNATTQGNALLSPSFENGNFTVVHNTSGSTFTIKANLKPGTAPLTIFYEGDYRDPNTGLTIKVVASVAISCVKTGTNAVYLLVRGQTSIEQATGSTKNVGVVSATLMRAGGKDESGITYKFFEDNGGTQINSDMNAKYGMKTVAFTANPSGTVTDVGTGLPSGTDWSSHNALVIHEKAVNDIGVYRVVAKDSDNKEYQAFFTVYDLSDPYDVRIISSAGDKLQNGVGSTNLTPMVYNGASLVSNLTGWKFYWTFFDKDGKRAAFIDTTKTAAAGGRAISANTTTVFTYAAPNMTFAAGNIIKCVTSSGDAKYFEVLSATSNKVTIRTTGLTNSWLSFGTPAASEFVGGRLYACVSTAGQVTTNGATALTVTGDEIDFKGTISCEADRP